jgi:transposase
MAIAQKDPLRLLTAVEQARLAQRSKSTSERLDRVRRARALRAVAAGASFAEAAAQAGFASRATVTALGRRFNQQGLAALAIAAGRGRRPTYDRAARAQIVATAQTPPQRRPDGTASGSLSTVPRHLRRAGWSRLSRATIRRVLGEAGSSYQRTRTWCPTGTAWRKRQSGVVQVTDPQTEQKRGRLSRRTGERRRRGSRGGARMKRGPIRRCPPRGRGGNPRGIPRARRTSTSETARPNS